MSQRDSQLILLTLKKWSVFANSYLNASSLGCEENHKHALTQTSLDTGQGVSATQARRVQRIAPPWHRLVKPSRQWSEKTDLLHKIMGGPSTSLSGSVGLGLDMENASLSMFLCVPLQSGELSFMQVT